MNAKLNLRLSTRPLNILNRTFFNLNPILRDLGELYKEMLAIVVGKVWKWSRKFKDVGDRVLCMIWTSQFSTPANNWHGFGFGIVSLTSATCIVEIINNVFANFAIFVENACVNLRLYS